MKKIKMPDTFVIIFFVVLFASLLTYIVPVGIVTFLLVVGGAFGIILKTGAVESGIYSMISKSKGSELVLIPVIFILFSLGGAVFGMGEEAIPFAMLIIPIVIDMGYDSVTGILTISSKKFPTSISGSSSPNFS